MFATVHPPASKEALNRGMDFHRAGRLVEAAACYESVLREKPGNSDVLHLLGLVRAAEGQLEQGIALIKKAVKYQPRFAAAHFNLGNLLRKQGKREDAVTAYQRALSVQHKFAEAHCNLGCTLDALGRLDEASAALRRAISDNKDYAEAHRNFGLVQQKRGQFADAIDSLKRAVSLNPSDATTCCDFGIILLAQGHSAEAIEAFRRSVTLNPQEARAWLNLGDAFRCNERNAEAVLAYGQVLTLLPKSAETLRLLGNTLTRSDDASLVKKEALALDPLYVIALNNLGSTLLIQGDIASAVEAWSQTAPVNSIPRRTSPSEAIRTASKHKRLVTLETAEYQLSFDFSILVLTAEIHVTVCAPALGLIATAATETEALQLLDLQLLEKAEGSRQKAATASRSVVLLDVITGSSKPHRHHSIAESPEQFFLFAQQLNEAHHLRESLACLRAARALGLQTKHFNFYHGLLSAVDHCIEEAIPLYLQAITACVQDSENPVSYGSCPLPQYLLQIQAVGRPDELLKEWSSLDLKEGYHATKASAPCAVTLQSHAAIDKPRRVIDSTLTALLEIEAHNLVAEDLINYHCDFAGADEIYLRRNCLQATLLKSYGINEQDTLFLDSDWMRNIGHISYLEHLIRMRDLDLAPWRHIVVLSRQDKVANFAYLKYLSQYVIVVTDPDLIERFEPLVTVCGFRFSNLFPLAGDEPKSTSEIGNAITARCEMAGIGALLALDPRDREAGRSALEKFGVKHNDWFVCLHVREMGYHVGADQNHRNAAIETYFLAIEAITRRGGWVIRLGDASMSTLPKMERVIDYPHTDLKSPAMDVFLCAECHFMIGMNSGLSNVPYSFGRPVVMINWVNTGSLPSYPRDGLFLPKLIYSDAEKRPLSFREALSPEWRARSYSAAKLRENGARLVDNTPSEIKDVVLEMLARLNGTQEVTKDHQQLDERFLSLLEKDPLRGIAKIGSAFLKTHQSLL